jgi:ABC-type cobalamin/Fe3+-siderophores transport system ATPase subunit
MPVALEVRNLWKCYAAGVRGCSARVWVLRGVTLRVERGEWVGVIGAEGAGKTTLLQCLRGLRRPDAGVVQVAQRAGSDLLLLDQGECLADAMANPSCAAVVAARDAEALRGIVDRWHLLHDGKLVPFDPPGRARRVAERAMRRC